MKELTITSHIRTCSIEELSEKDRELVLKAMDATSRSYAPYSKFSVGAALRLANEQIITGCNQENAAFPSGICAERTAVFYANAQYPEQAIKTLAIAAYNGKEFVDRPISPCGACRQVILEAETRYDSPIKLLLCGKKDIYIIKSIRDLLPLSFDSL